MAVSDDMRWLATRDVVYLTKVMSGTSVGPAEVFQGKLRQTSDGSWLFKASTRGSCVVGFDLGPVSRQWTSKKTRAIGSKVSISFGVYAGATTDPSLAEHIVLSAVPPEDFTK
jgi:hypothetical protein